MATEKECAALTALVDNLHGAADARVEAIVPPAGWSLLMESPTDPAISGFHAKSFIDDSGDCILAFKGADFFTDALKCSDGPDEFTTNLALDIGLAPFIQSMSQAARLYAQVRRWMLDKGWDGRRITLTGHGVGGGIASVMAVWFDQPCMVFAQAPLRAVATSPGDFVVARSVVEPMLAVYDDAVLRMLAFVKDPQGVLAQREHRVQHWHVRADVLQPLRSQATAIIGTNHVIDIDLHPASVDEQLAMHDMSLHAALLYEPRLRPLCKHIPDLFPLLTQKQHLPLIVSLLNDQHRLGFDAEGALGRLADDLEKVRNPEAASDHLCAIPATIT